MPWDWDERRDGPINGLRLPRSAWKALRQANISTLEQLKVGIDRIERLEGIGPKTAQLIREEILRLTSHK
jgi:endonuclease III